MPQYPVHSGLYSCSGALYALSHEGLAPAWLGQTNRFGVPHSATLFSIAGCWLALAMQVIDPADLFVKLLAISGFSEADRVDIHLLVSIAISQ